MTDFSACVATVATCNLNQWALDFDGNVERIKQSVEEGSTAGRASALGQSLRFPAMAARSTLHTYHSAALDHTLRP